MTSPLLASVDFIVVHHTAGSDSETVADIARYHESRGFYWSYEGQSGTIGYHRLYDQDGKVHYTRPLEIQGAHAGPSRDKRYPGLNRVSWGVCFKGNYSKRKSWTTPAAKAGLANIVTLCRLKGLGADRVIGHHEVPGASTECPGKNINMSKVRGMIAELLKASSGEPVKTVAARIPMGPQYAFAPALPSAHAPEIHATLTDEQVDAALNGCHVVAAAVTELGIVTKREELILAGHGVELVCKIADKIVEVRRERTGESNDTSEANSEE